MSFSLLSLGAVELMRCQACRATCSVALIAVTTRGNIVLVWSSGLTPFCKTQFLKKLLAFFPSVLFVLMFLTCQCIIYISLNTFIKYVKRFCAYFCL